MNNNTYPLNNGNYNETQLDNLAETVRETQYSNSLQDLVFNPNTGEFEQKPHGTSGAGDIVTDMTKDGFAQF